MQFKLTNIPTPICSRLTRNHYKHKHSHFNGHSCTFTTASWLILKVFMQLLKINEMAFVMGQMLFPNTPSSNTVTCCTMNQHSSGRQLVHCRSFTIVTIALTILHSVNDFNVRHQPRNNNNNNNNNNS